MEGFVDVVIPVYRPDKRLRELLEKLIQQSVQPRQILLINTEEKLFDPELLEGVSREHTDGANRMGGASDASREAERADHSPLIRVEHIRKEQFDHGGTRHMAVSMLDGAMEAPFRSALRQDAPSIERNASRLDGANYILFLTQDAVPQDEFLIENLLRAFENPQVGAAYARQLPRSDCKILERYSRGFNYPDESRMKTKADLPELGIKTYFCSNVCAMYRRSAYEALGGFERHTIFNEDMIFAAKLIQAGWAVAYCADAKVIHSHNYTGLEQLQRNFDLGVSQAEHPEVFSGVRSESEGIRLIRQTARYLVKKRKPWLLVSLIWQSGCKYIGYRLGKNYRRLPKTLVLACTMNKEYWKS